jgi:hypothetical protein
MDLTKGPAVITGVFGLEMPETRNPGGQRAPPARAGAAGHAHRRMPIFFLLADTGVPAVAAWLRLT